jgi:hypothetical protein
MAQPITAPLAEIEDVGISNKLSVDTIPTTTSTKVTSPALEFNR